MLHVTRARVEPVRSTARVREHRTPGFCGWQQEQWLFHCGDGAACLGRVGAQEILQHPDAVACLRQGELSSLTDDRYLAALDANGQPTAYLFRCLHCGTHLAYSDYT